MDLNEWQEYVDNLEERNRELKRDIKDIVRLYDIPVKQDKPDFSFIREFPNATGFVPPPQPYIEILERKIYI